MNGKTISHVQGKGSIAHNNRLFSPKNVDGSRTPDNVCYIQKPIAEAYSEIFDNAVSEYNAKQKRADRKIKNGYYEHLFNHAPSASVIESPNGQKSFYEDVVQIGTMHDTGIGSADAEIAKSCLDEYMRGFQERNPNFIVFNAVLHMDEATPHLHIDYIPIGHYTRGVSIQNGIAQALKEMGYGGGKDAISRWRMAERNVLKEICISRGIEITEEKEGRGYSMKCEEYKEHEDKIHAYKEQEKALEAELQTLLDTKAAADSVSVQGKKVPIGNSRIVSGSEFEMLNNQRKILAVEQEKVKAKSDNLERERLVLEEKSKELDERSDNLDKRSESLDKRSDGLNEREKSLDSREKEIQKKEEAASETSWKATALYDKQLHLNERYEKLTSDVADLNRELLRYRDTRDELLKARVELDNEKTKNKREREKEIEEITLEHRRELREKDEKIKSLSADYETASEELEKSKSENSTLKEKIKTLVENNDFLAKFIKTMYEVGRYFGKLIGYNFDEIVDARADGYSLSYLMGDRGRDR